MELTTLGLPANDLIAARLDEENGLIWGRVSVEQKERYTVESESGTYLSEVTGNLRYSAESRADFPAVGDWVKLTVIDDQTAIIVQLIPRKNALERQSVKHYGSKQIIASNIDCALITVAVGQDLNINRIERYMSICHTASIEPIIVITKTDQILPNELEDLLSTIEHRIVNVPIVMISNIDMSGFDQLRSIMKGGVTYCVLGSSGVGKSTMINNLSEEKRMEVNSVSSSTHKGRHTTTHRELFVLPNASIIIDTPGMRELGVLEEEQGIRDTFVTIEELAPHCKFNDCQHQGEHGCAVSAAIEEGKLSEQELVNYHKLQREQQRFNSEIHERRSKDKKQGQLYKQIQQSKRSRNT